MRPVNLIPPEDRRGEHAPLRAGFASYAIVGALVVALVGVVLVVLTGNQITDARPSSPPCRRARPRPTWPQPSSRPTQDFATLSAARSETVSASRRAGSTGSAS